MDKLLTCPFCGYNPEFIIRDNEDIDIACGTPDCYLETGGAWSFEVKEDAIKVWNNRPYKVLEIL